MLRYTGMCCPNGFVFHKNSLGMGPFFVKKSLKEDPILRKLLKIVQNSCFCGGKPLEMGPDFKNFDKAVESVIF